MRAWTFDAFGLDRLRLTERAAPEPGPGQALVRLGAVSLNYRDVMMVRGEYDPRAKLPLVPCSDGVGRVVAVGPGVTRLAVGDRVCPLFSQTWVTGPPSDAGNKGTLGGPLDGTLAEYVLISAEAAVKPPAHLSDAEAACLPCAGVTAWRALVLAGRMHAGSTVLVLGTGGVALLALQIAVRLGARVAVVSSDDARIARAKAMGAEFGLNYRTDPKWGRPVRTWAGGAGVDLVIEVGGANTIGESLNAVRVDGTIAIIGVLGGSTGEVTLTRILMRSVRLQGVFVGNRDDFDALNAFLAPRHDLRPVVDHVFPFEQAPSAFEHVVARAHVGKVVVSVP